MISARSLSVLITMTFVVGACTAQPTPEITPQTSGESTQVATDTVTMESDAQPPSGAEFEFTTDFSIHSVDYDEILSGGPRKDGIPAIDEPLSVSIEVADEWLEEVEPVIRIQIGDEAKAYPIQILMWHEIVNDEVAGEPVTVTFCPLCNTGLAFERRLDGQILDFGTTGRLRFSNLIMYDRQTESWWQQATGEAIAGELTGSRLTFVNAPIISWAQFKEAHPDGQVLSRVTGHIRDYGSNPYVGYDDVNSPPFLYRGPELPDGELAMTERVLAVEIGGDVVAYPYKLLQERQVVNDTVGGQDLVVLWQAGTASALDSRSIAEGEDVGTANSYSRILDDQTLTFALVDGRIVDEQTSSEWNVLGTAISGQLEGTQLEEILSFNHFWFSWVVFMPETSIYK